MIQNWYIPYRSTSTITISAASKCEISVKTDGKIRYTVPQKITKDKDITVFFRVADVYKNVKVNVIKNGEKV